jgi:hypothetical protein
MLRLSLLYAFPWVVGLPPAGAQNMALLPNQDFEEQELGWSLWPAESESKAELDLTVAHSGKQSLRVTAVRAGDRAIVNTSTADFETEVIYRITVFLRKEARVADDAISYFINYRGGDDNAIQQRGFPVKLEKTPEGEWTRWTGLFFPPAGITQWQFCLGVEHTVGQVWFDDIGIEELGSAEDLTPDVWTNLPIGVEIGSAPAARFQQHKQANDQIYQAAARYNGLLMESAFAEKELRDLERCFAYVGRPAPEHTRRLFDASEQALNGTYLAYAKAFRSGEQADWAAFETEAGRLREAVVALRSAAAEQAAAIRPALLSLPVKLGRQDRAIEALEPTGNMNRLQFGAWSPEAWSQWEKPFELEFHASAPGSPRTHTETEIDFSNITERCDALAELGYTGTFGYLMFGIHENMYAPEWFVDKHEREPDLFKVSWDGLKGGSRGGLYCLNYFHPAVREFIGDYLTKYATFCRDEPRILFYETSQEAYMDFSTDKGRRESGYGPSAVKAFHEFLQRKYGTVAELNEAWGSQYESFDAIEPPPDCYVEPQRELTPLVAEFEAFRDDGYIGYLKLAYDALKAADPGKPVVARHSQLLSNINGARIFETCDVLCYHNRAPNMQLMNVYLNSLNRYHGKGLGYMEDFWGVQEEKDRASDEIAQRRGLEKHIARVCAWGRTLQMKWYAYTSGDYIFTYNGNWFNPRYDITTMRYCAPALAVAKRKMELLDWVLTHSEIVPSRVLVMQPSATMRNQRPDAAVFGEILALHQLLYRSGVLYELVPEEYFEDGRADFASFDVAILPRATCLSADLQSKLAAFTTSGGTLIAVGEPGTHDELARPSGGLVAALPKAAEGNVFAQAEAAWRQAEEPETEGRSYAVVPCGKGQLVASPPVMAVSDEKARPELVKLITGAAPRAAWAESSRFEVVLRIAEDGGRYLFVFNPDVDNPAQDTVRVAEPARQAVDVTIPDGFPVRTRPADGGSAMDVQLGPGESAVLYLGAT